MNIIKLLTFDFHWKFVSSGKIMYICDNMMEATEEGRSQNILLNAKCVVCCHHEYIYIYINGILLSKNMSL